MSAFQTWPALIWSIILIMWLAAFPLIWFWRRMKHWEYIAVVAMEIAVTVNCFTPLSTPLHDASQEGVWLFCGLGLIAVYSLLVRLSKVRRERRRLQQAVNEVEEIVADVRAECAHLKDEAAPPSQAEEQPSCTNDFPAWPQNSQLIYTSQTTSEGIQFEGRAYRPLLESAVGWAREASFVQPGFDDPWAQGWYRMQAKKPVRQEDDGQAQLM